MAESYKNYTIAELGHWVHLSVKRAGNREFSEKPGEVLEKREKDLMDAQNYLDMMQAHIDAATAMANTKNATEPSPELTAVTVVKNVVPEPKSEHTGSPRDDDGNITRISTQVSDPGYDPEIHLNQELKILCDDVHFPTAHTADTVEGLVRYYEKSTKGRIKTLERRGKVEIRGI